MKNINQTSLKFSSFIGEPPNGSRLTHTHLHSRLRKLNDWGVLSCRVETYEEEMPKEEASDDLENLSCQVEDISSHNDTYMLSQFFRGWFMYSRLSSSEQLKLEAQANRSRWTGGFVGCLRSLFHICDNRRPNYSSRVAQVEI